ncbi:hypothetical protein [Ruegeria denitrificans]|nr:hypothetical protein [Ruegeria denitrificans]
MADKTLTKWVNQLVDTDLDKRVIPALRAAMTGCADVEQLLSPAECYDILTVRPIANAAPSGMITSRAP